MKEAAWKLELSRWVCAPHKSGGKNTLGCDCVGFVCAATARVQGKSLVIPRIPADSFFFDKELAKAGFRELIKNFPGKTISFPLQDEESLRIGDWLVCYQEDAPAHIGIVGDIKDNFGIAYHCSSKAKHVVMVPFHLKSSTTSKLMYLDEFEVRKIYRLES